MTEQFAGGLVSALGGLTAWKYGRQLIVFIISMMPILELRGGLIAASLLDMSPLQSYIIAIAGNLIPVPFILFLFNWIMDKLLLCRIGFIRSFAGWISRNVDRHKAKIEKVGFWGLVLFVGIPLPGTGAWTGCAVASVLHMDKKRAFLAVLIGVFMASIIMMAISFGLISGIRNAL